MRCVAPLERFIDEQRDIRELEQNLAQQINTIRSGTHPGDTSTGSNAVPQQASSESSLPSFLVIGEGQKGTPGRGREKKRHDNLRHVTTISDIFSTRHDNFRQFFDVCLFAHVTEIVIKRHKSVIKCHDNFRHFFAHTFWGGGGGLWGGSCGVFSIHASRVSCTVGGFFQDGKVTVKVSEAHMQRTPLLNDVHSDAASLGRLREMNQKFPLLADMHL